MASRQGHDEKALTGESRIVPIGMVRALKSQVYDILRETVSNMDIYSAPELPRLDERKLADELGVSRTPVREALSRLEQEGFVRNIPRRGTFVIRKTRREVLEVVYATAALESMAARLASENATDAELVQLHALCDLYDSDEARIHIHEYSQANVEFHQTLIGLSRCDLIKTMAGSLHLHMRAIRSKAIKDLEHHRSDRSVSDHRAIVAALQQRDANLAEKLVRDHALSLGEHIEEYAPYLD